jgi:hypothetical protein
MTTAATQISKAAGRSAATKTAATDQKSAALVLADGADGLDRQIQKANVACGVAVREAMIAGQMLLELRARMLTEKANNQHTPAELRFKACMEEAAQRNSVSERTLWRWIGAAENGFGAVLAHGHIDVEAMSVPLSVALTAPEAELPEEVREVRQLLFDFADNTTLKDAHEGVIVGGDDPSRIKRAHNGQTKGGSNGEDRKDYPAFIKSKLAHITTHLEHWDTYTAGQKDAVITAWANAVEDWPTAALELIAGVIKKEQRGR